MIDLLGAPVARSLNDATRERVARLALEGREAKLFIVRVGGDESDAAYLRGISRAAEATGVGVELAELEPNVPEGELEGLLLDLSADPDVSGILLLRPLPAGLDERRAAACIAPGKDVDAMGDRSLAALFAGERAPFAPATAKAVMELLDYYGYALRGRVGCVLGRSTVVGRPLQALLTAADATVTLCHSKTSGIAEICRRSEFVIACVGVPGFLTPEMVGDGAWVVDVGVNVTPEGGLVGDVDPAVAEVAGALTPVPGGVGAVTAATLISQVARAAERSMREEGNHG